MIKTKTSLILIVLLLFSPYLTDSNMSSSSDIDTISSSQSSAWELISNESKTFNNFQDLEAIYFRQNSSYDEFKVVSYGNAPDDLFDDIELFFDISNSNGNCKSPYMDGYDFKFTTVIDTAYYCPGDTWEISADHIWITQGSNYIIFTVRDYTLDINEDNNVYVSAYNKETESDLLIDYSLGNPKEFNYTVDKSNSFTIDGSIDPDNTNDFRIEDSGQDTTVPSRDLFDVVSTNNETEINFFYNFTDNVYHSLVDTTMSPQLDFEIYFDVDQNNSTGYSDVTFDAPVKIEGMDGKLNVSIAYNETDIEYQINLLNWSSSSWNSVYYGENDGNIAMEDVIEFRLKLDQLNLIDELNYGDSMDIYFDKVNYKARDWIPNSVISLPTQSGNPFVYFVTSGGSFSGVVDIYYNYSRPLVSHSITLEINNTSYGEILGGNISGYVFSFNTTDVPNGEYNMYISLHNGSYVWDWDSINITIDNQNGSSSNIVPTILNPEAGSNFTIGTIIDIIWEVTPTGSYTFDLYYSDNAGSDFISIELGIQTNSFNWDTSDLPASSNYMIKLVVHTSTFSVEETTGLFSLVDGNDDPPNIFTPLSLTWLAGLVAIPIIRKIQVKRDT